MRRLIACLTLAAAASMGAATSADDPEIPEVPPVDQPTPPVPAPAEEAPLVESPADDSDEAARALRLFAEATAWFTQPVGVDYVYATQFDPNAIFGTTTRNQEFGTSDRARWRAGALIAGDVGSFVITYWGATVAENVSALYPGQFILGETLTYPFFAGINNDGRADGVQAYSETTTRDTRIDFLRDAFKTGRMSAKWLAGLRFVDHNQSIAASYYALSPNLPPLIDGQGQVATDLIPAPDSAYRDSRFSGRGIEAGFEASYQVLPKLHLEGSFVYALLRGHTRAKYASLTHAYTLTDPQTQAVFVLAPADYEDVFGDSLFYDFLNQVTFAAGVQDDGSSNSASVLEAGLGFRWKAWRTLEVLGGIRQSRYQDAVLEIRPRDPTLSADGTFNFQTIDKEYRSIAYEGYYLGLAYTF